MIKLKEDYPDNVLARQLWEISDKAFPYGSPWNEAQFLSDIANESSFYLVYEVNQQVIGYVTLHVVLDEAEIINIAVSPAFKGQQVALSLFQEACLFLQKKAVTTLFLEVREQNTPAISLYRKVGFKEISRRKNYYHQPQEDGLVMTLEIK